MTRIHLTIFANCEGPCNAYEAARLNSDGLEGFQHPEFVDAVGNLSRWFKKHVDRRIPKPILIAGWGPAALEDQVGVRVRATQRPDDGHPLRWGYSRAQAAAAFQNRRKAEVGHLLEYQLLSFAVTREQPWVA